MAPGSTQTKGKMKKKGAPFKQKDKLLQERGEVKLMAKA
jgi:hypothetical protein